MVKRTRAAAVLLVGLCLARGDVPAAQSAQDGVGAAKTDRLTLDIYLDFERVSDPQISPDGTPGGLPARVGRQAEGQMGVGALDRERRRQQEPLPREGELSAMVAGRDAHRVHRPGRAEGDADLRALDGRRRRHDPGDDESRRPPRAIAWSPDGTSIAFVRCSSKKRLAGKIDLPAAPEGAKWTEAPRIVERLDYRQRSHRLHRRGLPPCLRRDRIGRNAAAAHRRATTIDGEHRVDSRRPEHPLHRSCARRSASTLARDRRSTPSTSTTARSGSSPTARGRTATRRSRPTARCVAYTGYDWTDDTFIDSKLYVMIDGRLERRSRRRSIARRRSCVWAADGSGVYFNVAERGLAEPVLRLAARAP